LFYGPESAATCPLPVWKTGVSGLNRLYFGIGIAAQPGYGEGWQTQDRSWRDIQFSSAAWCPTARCTVYVAWPLDNGGEFLNSCKFLQVAGKNAGLEKHDTPFGRGCVHLGRVPGEFQSRHTSATARKKAAQPLSAIRDTFCPSKQGEGRWTWGFLFVADAYRAEGLLT
jgi:hypothetical protein